MSIVAEFDYSKLRGKIKEKYGTETKAVTTAWQGYYLQQIW